MKLSIKPPTPPMELPVMPPDHLSIDQLVSLLEMQLGTMVIACTHPPERPEGGQFELIVGDTTDHVQAMGLLALGTARLQSIVLEQIAKGT